MLEAEPCEGSTAPDLETLRSSLRAFGQLRQRAAVDQDGSGDPLRAGHDLPPPEILPIDSTKAFVGLNSNYYDESWRVMEWRGVSRSWNWAAALTLGGWLAWRRLYDHAVLHAAWLTLLILLALGGTPIGLVLLVQLSVAVLLGAYGNALYRRRFRRAAAAAARHDGEYSAKLAALAAAGGADFRAVWIMAAAMVGITACVIAFRQSVGGVRLTL
ncbi:MAG: DUF2628 domain-containing protein [Geminicoccaceae bacterium]